MIHLILIVLGSMFLTNALPHLVNGLSGRAFQSPFARPMGEGLSSATVNVLWGAVNLGLAWALLVRWGHLDLTHLRDAAAMLVGVVAIGLVLARHFGRFHGGNL